MDTVALTEAGCLEAAVGAKEAPTWRAVPARPGRCSATAIAAGLRGLAPTVMFSLVTPTPMARDSLTAATAPRARVRPILVGIPVPEVWAVTGLVAPTADEEAAPTAVPAASAAPTPNAEGASSLTSMVEPVGCTSPGRQAPSRV